MRNYKWTENSEVVVVVRMLWNKWIIFAWIEMDGCHSCAEENVWLSVAARRGRSVQRYHVGVVQIADRSNQKWARVGTREPVFECLVKDELQCIVELRHNTYKRLKLLSIIFWDNEMPFNFCNDTSGNANAIRTCWRNSYVDCVNRLCRGPKTRKSCHDL